MTLRRIELSSRYLLLKTSRRLRMLRALQVVRRERASQTEVLQGAKEAVDPSAAARVHREVTRGTSGAEFDPGRARGFGRV